MLRFYWRVLRRVPGVFVDTAGKVGAAALLVAVVVLWGLSDKKLASGIVGFQGYSPIWAIVPCALILAYGLAKANYEEAKLLGAPTNRTDPAPSHITIGNVNIFVGGTNSALPPDALPAQRPQETQTEREGDQ